MFYEKKLKIIFYVLNILEQKQMFKRLFSSLNVNLPHAVKMFDSPKCKDCKHFVPHTGPLLFSDSKMTVEDLGRCKLLGYYAITCRTHWLSSIACGHEGRFFEPK